MSVPRDRLRARLRAARAALDEGTREAAERAVTDRLLPVVESRSPMTVAGYVAVRGELSPEATLRECRARGIVTLLPVLEGDTLAFMPYDEGSVMRPNRFRIDEPAGEASARVAPMDIDVVLVPLVGFDVACARLGMGGGFYDRSFAPRRGHGAPPFLIGVAHELQCVDSVFPDWWDVPLDAVVTETGVRRRAGRVGARSPGV